MLFAVGFYGARDLRIGDLDPGAPELRPDSRYNLDNAYLTENYSTSTDVFVTMVETPTQACGNHETVAAIDRFQTPVANLANGGGTWAEYSVTRAQMETRVGTPIRAGAPGLWDWLAPRLDTFFADVLPGPGQSGTW